MIQSTLTGGEASDRTRPGTMLWCDETEQWVLRSKRYDWPHELYESPSDVPSPQDETIHTSVTVDDGDDGPEEVGGVFDITLSYSVNYSFSIPASYEDVALDRAKELVWDSSPRDMDHVHTRKQKRKTLYEDDDIVPDDWDPYGSTPLWMAIDEAKNDE